MNESVTESPWISSYLLERWCLMNGIQNMSGCRVSLVLCLGSLLLLTEARANPFEIKITKSGLGVC